MKPTRRNRILSRCLVIVVVALVLTTIFHFVLSTDSNPHNGVLIVNTDRGQGSCFIVAHRGEWWYAITAAHVVEVPIPGLMPPILTLTVDDERYVAGIQRVDKKRDLALIRFKSPETYHIYYVSKTHVGEACTVVGWSSGSQLVYHGYVVSMNYRGHMTMNGGLVPGCSGGAVLNPWGRVVGVAVASPIYRGMTFDTTTMCVPSRFVESMIVTIEE